jgi:stress response protein YsnF
MLTVIGAFDDRTEAQRAVDQLVQRGFDRGDVHIEQQEGEAVTTRATTHDNDPRPESDGGGFFSHLFGGGSHHEHASTYHEAVRRGSSVVVVDARDEAQAEQAVECLHQLGAVNVDERAQQWRASGWSPQPAQQNLQSRDTQRDAAPRQGQEGVMDVVQEELQVGKRSLDRGGVRVVQRVTEKPVREVVRLREEHATVDRRPVDRPATAGDLNAFKEGTLEVRETAEEAVVAKSARVVEEVRVGKEVREREETIEDKVRRKDVDVQRMEGGGTRGTVERERAVASDRPNEPPLADRDPDAGTTGTRKTLRKNNPST